jgi:hypothetical protein
MKLTDSIKESRERDCPNEYKDERGNNVHRLTLKSLSFKEQRQIVVKDNKRN